MQDKIAIVDIPNLVNLKKILLIFDKVSNPFISEGLARFWLKNDTDQELLHFHSELQYLVDEGYIYDTQFLIKDLVSKIDGSTMITVTKQDLDNIKNYSLNREEVHNSLIRLCSNFLNKFNFNTTPIIENLFLAKNPSANDPEMITKSDVIKIVIDNMPIPDDGTSWENIFEFKNNSDNKGMLAGLNVWINKTVKSGSTIPEIKDELEYLLYQYKKNLEIHKIRYQHGIFQSFIVGTAETAENIIKLNFSTIVKKLFTINQNKVELLKAEQESPGNELGYMYRAKKKFEKID